MFWLWFLADGGEEIKLPVDDDEVIIQAAFLSGDAAFGIPADKKSLIEIIAAEHEVDWNALADVAAGGTEEE